MLQAQPLTEQARNYPGLKLESIENTVLSTIINRKVEDELQKEALPLPSLDRRLVLEDFQAALTYGSGRHFILECKQSSPSLGDFCRDFNLDRLLDCYNRHAAAISVLCEEHFFKGSLEYLTYVKERSQVPVLCKDFIICKRQLEEAFTAGADAVLLMLSVLKPERFIELFEHCRDLGLAALCEVDTEEDARLAHALKLPVCGVNNRDLRVLKIDLNRSLRLAPLLSHRCSIVAESGISTHADLLSLKPLKNFLIGSSLSGSEDVFFKANSMLYGLNKICGIKTKEGLEAALKAHAAIAGLIFVKKSPRCVSLKQAEELIAQGRPYIRFAGVFQNEDLAEVVKLATQLELEYLQLHGQEDEAYLDELKARLPQVQLIKALAVKNQEDLGEVERYLDHCDLLLLDSASPGSGRAFDWNALPDTLPRERMLLSGGIGPDNVERALQLNFAGLDLNSRLEREKGIKDPELIEQTFAIINSY